MKVALLGGAFNPPHLGHLWIARQVLDFTDVDRVWYVPNFGQKYFGITPHKVVASVEDRIAMTRLTEFSCVTTSTIETDHKLDGQTIHLLPLLPAEHEFSFIIGSDQLPRFNQWYGYEELTKAMRFLVFPRFGYPIEQLYPGMEVVDHEEFLVTTNISSTKVRARVAKNLPISGFVDPSVERYIYNHGLYREGIGLHKEGTKKQR